MNEPDILTVEVTVTGFVPGDPPLLAWHKRLHGVDGKQKVHAQWTPVLDSRLIERLQQQVQPGDPITITIATDSSKEGAPTRLTDFSASVAHAARMSQVNSARTDDEMRDEYDLRGGVRGKYSEQYRQGVTIVTLEPDVAAVFGDSESVNHALRLLMSVAREQLQRPDVAGTEIIEVVRRRLGSIATSRGKARRSPSPTVAT